MSETLVSGMRHDGGMATELETLSNLYEQAEAAFLLAARDGASRKDLARVAHTVAQAAETYNAEAYRKLHAGEEDAWMPLDNLTDITELLSDLWRDLAVAFSD